MYQTLLSKIQTTLDTVTAIKATYAYPTSSITSYPAVVYFPDSFDNSFETSADNMKVYRFRMFVVVGATQKTNTDIFSTVLPKAVDAVLAAFDAGWDGGTISGHRAWMLMNSGLWSMAETQQGLEATAELSLQVKVATTN